MAQNNYGLTLISVACFLFSVMFLNDIFFRKDKGLTESIESLGLAVLAALFGLRASYIHIPYIEWVVVLDSLMLAGIYLSKLYHIFQNRKANNRFMIFIMAFYLGLILLLASMAISIISPIVSEALGALGFGMFIFYGAGYFMIKRGLIAGEEFDVLKYVRKSNPNAMVLATTFFLISVYTGLYMIHLAPPLYTGKVPPTYLELVRQAESGNENAVDGSFQHDHYKAAYDAFVKKNR